MHIRARQEPMWICEIWLHGKYVNVVVVFVRLKHHRSVCSRWHLPNVCPLCHYCPAFWRSTKSSQTQGNVTDSFSLDTKDSGNRRRRSRTSNRVNDEVSKASPGIVLEQLYTLVNTVCSISPKTIQGALAICDKAGNFQNFATTMVIGDAGSLHQRFHGALIRMLELAKPTLHVPTVSWLVSFSVIVWRTAKPRYNSRPVYNLVVLLACYKDESAVFIRLCMRLAYMQNGHCRRHRRSVSRSTSCAASELQLRRGQLDYRCPEQSLLRRGGLREKLCTGEALSSGNTQSQSVRSCHFPKVHSARTGAQ